MRRGADERRRDHRRDLGAQGYTGPMRSLAALAVTASCGFTGPRLDGAGDAQGGGDGAPPMGCIRDVDAERFFTCAARSDGTGWCWGDNQNRQVGDNTTTNRTTPTRVGALTNITHVATSSRTGYALDANGTMWAWGLNDAGQLGDGTQTDRGDPRAVPGVASVVEIDAGRGHACARTATGDVYCWGDNSDQQTGDRMPGQDRSTPFRAITNATQITAGGRHTCARLATGEATCWGDNAKGEMGRGATSGDEPPTVIPSFPVAEIAAGGRHTCARKADGTVWCFGDNRYGQVGVTGATEIPTPVQVPGIDDATQLMLGGRRSCARRATGAIWCWGERLFGNPGTGQSSVGNESPHAIPELAGAGLVVSSAYHVCGVTAAGALVCAGRDDEGQLGDGTSSSRATYAPVALSCP